MTTDTAPSADDLLTVAEAAAIAGVSRSQMSRRIAGGWVAARRLSPRVLLIRRGDLDAAIATGPPAWGWTAHKARTG